MTNRQKTTSEKHEIAEVCRDLVLRRHARRNCSPEKEDVAQDAFVRALSIRTAEVIRDPVRYVLRIARNLLIDRRRRNRRETTVLDRIGAGQLATDMFNPERILSAKQELRRVAFAIDSLPPRCREAFELHRFEHLSYSAIARRMGVSTGTVEKHIAEAMLRITLAIRDTGEAGHDGA